ncbi:MAG: TrkH family potassium uptake protein [Carbonactinosporaceae bacterium]
MDLPQPPGRRRDSGLTDRRAGRASPFRIVVAGFAVAVLAGTALLVLPIAKAGEIGHASVLEALFTSTSAVCLTGLIVVDTPTFWSPFGELVILALIQIGGFGIMTFASFLGLLVTRRLALRTRLSIQAETRSLELGDVRGIVLAVAATTLLIEAVTALLLAGRFATGYDEPLGEALYLGVFHAVSAFNNAGFALFSTNLEAFVTDAWICLPIAGAAIAGGLGFPVLLQLHRELRRTYRWSLQTRITLLVSPVLLAAGLVAVLAIEWANPATLGRLDVPGKLLAAFFQSMTPRTAGFNTLDYGEMHPATLLATDILMFIGGGSAGTAGGIKVTTFALLAFVIFAEIRGEQPVHALGRRVPDGAQRQALSVALLGVGAVVLSTIALLGLTRYDLDAVLFEVVSAFGTVGLSTGITADLPAAAHAILIALMFAGRLGPVTLASALALRERAIRYRLPEERPIVG